MTVIWNHWIFMHFTSYSMTHKFTHHTISVLFAMMLNRISDIPKTMTDLSCINSKIKTFFCYLQ